MTLTVSTVNLVGLLVDALQTADKSGELGLGVHLATHRDGYGDEPGLTDLLAATSTDRYVVGHGFTPVDGQIMASVWPVDATKTVIHMCQNLISTYGKEHTVDIEVVQLMPRKDVGKDGEDAHPTYMVTLRETPALFDSDTEFQFQASSELSFPTRTVWRALTGQATDPKYRESLETGWSPRVLAAVTAVARRQKETMWWYRTPGGYVQRVQVGEAWLGAAMPIRPAPGAPRQEPSIEPLLVAPEDDPNEGGFEGQVVGGEVVDVIEDPLPEIGSAPTALEAVLGDRDGLDDDEDEEDDQQ